MLVVLSKTVFMQKVISRNYKTFEFPARKMDKEMFEQFGRYGAIIGGVFIGILEALKNLSKLGEIFTGADLAMKIFVFTFSAIGGGILGKVGGELYALGKRKVLEYIRKRNFNQKK